jgi:hypothetical protein
MKRQAERAQRLCSTEIVRAAAGNPTNAGADSAWRYP